MRNALAITALSLASAMFCGSAAAEPLAKSGSISVHSGYMVVAEVVTVAEKVFQGHGNNRGITFNDKGSGPLHLGPTDCFTAFSTIGDNARVKGYCSFGDADGDRIFTDYKGALQPNGYYEGDHVVDGGTGKYAGIQGTMTFKCKFSGKNGELECIQRLDYRLP